ncbi:MAG: riboflavin synthase [Acidobacteria bacterium]|nr:MAG: riboflavin synthase [Acidobacteriota bacterium]
MFNGIIEVVGRIESFKNGKLLLDGDSLARQTKPGDSIAVDGVCLTVVKRQGRKLQIDVSAETLRRTNLKHRTADDRVNLELPIRGDTFISGHFVQGHVEGVARVGKWKRTQNDVLLRLKLPSDLIPFCIPKGSIAVNGVSLTIAEFRPPNIGIALIPYTLKHTNLGDLKAGEIANIETDMVGRYVVSFLRAKSS